MNDLPFGNVPDLSQLGKPNPPEVDTYPCPVCQMPMPRQFSPDLQGLFVCLSIVMHQNLHVMQAMAPQAGDLEAATNSEPQPNRGAAIAADQLNRAARRRDGRHPID